MIKRHYFVHAKCYSEEKVAGQYTEHYFTIVITSWLAKSAEYLCDLALNHAKEVSDYGVTGNVVIQCITRLK